MKFAIISFPGTSCDHDVYFAIKDELGEEAEIVGLDAKLDGYDGIILPGGVSYGNYVRPGAIAALTPIMDEVKKAAEEGKPILGINNGFQILLEAGLLEGAMRRNKGLTFICKPVQLTVENNQTMFTSEYGEKEEITIPVAHGDGNYYCDEKTLAKLKENNQIVFAYKDQLDGSVENIAGIINEKGNVLGMMPLPERAVSELLGSTDGLKLFQSIVKQWRETHVTQL